MININVFKRRSFSKSISICYILTYNNKVVTLNIKDVPEYIKPLLYSQNFKDNKCICAFRLELTNKEEELLKQFVLELEAKLMIKEM